jgi:hypothetical protein
MLCLLLVWRRKKKEIELEGSFPRAEGQTHLAGCATRDFQDC